MTEHGRPAIDLLSELLSNDHPLNHFGREVVDLNRSHDLDYGDGLRDLILDVRSNPNGYRQLVKAFSADKEKEYPHGYPVEDGPIKWTMREMSDREFGAVDWTALADLVFPVLDEEGNEV